MSWALGSAGRKLAAAALALVLGLGCAGTGDDPDAEAELNLPELPPPLEDCAVMSILVDTSSQGDPKIAGRASRAMSREFREFGARITDSPEGAYWSLMILASQNSRHDGFILSALLTARTGREGYGQGMSVFSKGAKPDVSSGANVGTDFDTAAAPETERGVATLYNGIAFGPHSQLERQARALARQAYVTVYPAALRMCEYEGAEQQRERELEAQLPAEPRPL